MENEEQEDATSQVISTRLGKDHVQILKEYATAHGTKPSLIVKSIIEQYLNIVVVGYNLSFGLVQAVDKDGVEHVVDTLNTEVKERIDLAISGFYVRDGEIVWPVVKVGPTEPESKDEEKLE